MQYSKFFNVLIYLSTLSLTVKSQNAFDETYFRGDSKQIMATCADKARQIEPKDSRLLAEYGRAYLLSGDRARAEEAFKLAIVDDPKDGETHRLIGLAWLKAGFQQEAFSAFKLMVISDPKGRSAFAKAAVNLVDYGYIKEGEQFMIRSTQVGKKFDESKSNKELFDSIDLKPSDTSFIKPGAQFLSTGQPGNQGSRVALDVDALINFIHDGWDCVDFGRAALRAKHLDMAARWFALAVRSRPKEERIWNAVALAYADNGDHRK